MITILYELYNLRNLILNLMVIEKQWSMEQSMEFQVFYDTIRLLWKNKTELENPVN